MLKALLLVTLLAGGPAPDILLAQGYSRGKPYTFVAKELPLISPLTKKRIVLEAEAADSFVDLLSDATKHGIHIEINYGHRTHKEQRSVKKWMVARGKGDLVAEPGWSTHESGLSLDIKGCIVFISNLKLSSKPKLKKDVVKWHKMGACAKSDKGYQCKTELYWWLKKNAPRYGFYNDVPKEPWHWSFDSPADQVEVGG